MDVGFALKISKAPSSKLASSFLALFDPTRVTSHPDFATLLENPIKLSRWSIEISALSRTLPELSLGARQHEEQPHNTDIVMEAAYPYEYIESIDWDGFDQQGARWRSKFNHPHMTTIGLSNLRSRTFRPSGALSSLSDSIASQRSASKCLLD
ncbi:hypothetical protein K439DRAFT_1622941 [Ramaria rubella]|nr:hypothetical protein K439DRAFT_1622941 [Ramaria rubella]